MFRKSIQKMIVICTVLLFFLSSSTVFAADYQRASQPQNNNYRPIFDMGGRDDYDPLCDIEVTVTIKEIRALDKIDLLSEADFYLKVFINGDEFQSDVWKNADYLPDLDWSATYNVDDFVEIVDIRIELWDWNILFDRPCDISKNDASVNDTAVVLEYSIAGGWWWGDDYVFYDPIMSDPSGYGRLNGCDDNSIYENDRDCEVFFEITQTDVDGDNIPYWVEEHYYHTDPQVDDTGNDYDCDDIPIEWEHRYDYNPKSWEDHHNIDRDSDGLDNVEEYMTSQWGSDPFRKDLFVELDQMGQGLEGEEILFPQGAKFLMRDGYSRHNIVFHMDDGCFGGGEIIPFDNATDRDELSDIYYNYFLHGNYSNWRRGVFHYAVVPYDAGWNGFVFQNGHNQYLDSVQISAKYHEELVYRNIFDLFLRKTFDREKNRALLYGAALMHEIGHTLGIFHSNTAGCDDQSGAFPWQLNYWKWRPYRSCMNYGFIYQGVVDYSDGSRGRNDFNDWNNIDLTFFQREFWWH